MSAFTLAEPRTLEEAVALLRGEAAHPFAGGTALMLMMKAGVFRPETLVSLRKLPPSCGAITAQRDGGLHIGAMATLRQIELSADVAAVAPVLCRTMLRLANVRVRNVATIGGALAHADPHLDIPPVLIALGATLEIAGSNGSRTLAAEQLFVDYLENALETGELITGVAIPSQAGRQTVYLKHTTRSADDWPALGIAVSARIESGAVRDIRAAIGAATDTPRRLTGVEAVLEGKVLDAPAMAAAGEAGTAEAAVRSDARGSAPYKRELIRVCIGRALGQLMQEGNG